MKVCINIKFREGPSGGGMRFSYNLKNYLTKNNISVVNTLADNDINIILNVSPYPFIFLVSSFSFIDAYAYKCRHPNTIIIQRINECDERKNTKFMNALLIKASHYADYQVYVSGWLKQNLIRSGMDPTLPSSVIFSGGDQHIFNNNNLKRWNGQGPLKIVTHHWSSNYEKGHDIYQQLDRILDDPAYRDKYQFSFIGNVPSNLTYRNTTIIPPLNGQQLADKLKEHHVYLSASRNEPGGMHIIEGGLCGLPLLYIRSGSLPEYSQGFGIEFTPKNFFNKLAEMYHTYEERTRVLPIYPHSADKMATQYWQLMQNLHNNSTDHPLKTGGQYMWNIHGLLILYSFLYIKSKILMRIMKKCFRFLRPVS